MPVELGKQGKAIWSAYQAELLSAADQALILELARCADTLDRLDGLVSGRHDSWASLVFDDMGEVHLSIDKAMDQRRNHQLAYKALFAEVRAAKLVPVKAVAPVATDEEPDDMLAKRRKEREERERLLG